MIINGKELNFNILKRSDAANFKKALEEMERKESEIKKIDEGDLISVLEAMDDLFRGFFITAIGVDVVGECDDIAEMTEMYDEFLKEVAKQRKSFKVPVVPKGKK